MRISFLADASLPHTRRWVDYFVRRGHECLLVSLEEGEGYDCSVAYLESTQWLPRFLRYTTSVTAAARHLRNFAPELVNAHFLPNYGWMATRMQARPLVLSTLGSDILVSAHRTALHRWRTRYVLARCDHVTSDGANLTREIATFGYPEERILTVPFGVEVERFEPAPERPESPIVILSTRRLEPVYDVETLLHAVGRVRREKRNRLVLRLAGSGSCEQALRRVDVEPRAQFLGWLDTPALMQELAAAHVYVSTSLSDSTSVSLLEAMAAGCLPVVSDIDGNREWVRDGENGLLFPSGDADALARCLEKAADDAPLRARAATANRQIVAERGSWRASMARVEHLFSGLAARARRRGVGA
ncbi:MAG: glycosyltransferase [Candidatus Latescibacterota bacterium]|nr:MAG: glycosyltransferase [Candidatus Latescibacterota bacterium]